MSKLENTQLTRSQLKKILHYDPETGEFHRYRKDGSLNPRPAGYFNGEHVTILVDGHYYTAHSLAWFYMGGDRDDLVLHQDGDKQNNRFDNLTYRKASPAAAPLPLNGKRKSSAYRKR